jgi:hypothetical protein
MHQPRRLSRPSAGLAPSRRLLFAEPISHTRSAGRARGATGTRWLLTLLLSVLLALALGLVPWVLAEDEFLEPDQAFRLSAEAAGADVVRVSW